MPAVLQRTETRVNGAFSADQVVASFGNGVPAALMQSLNATFVQSVRRFFEIGNQAVGPNGTRVANVYFFAGRAEGQASIGSIVGPGLIVDAFYARFGDVCRVGENNITISMLNPDCRPGAVGNRPRTYTMHYCVITQVGINVQAMDMVISHQTGLMYSHLSYN